jgi:hypothetical protein
MKKRRRPHDDVPAGLGQRKAALLVIAALVVIALFVSWRQPSNGPTKSTSSDPPEPTARREDPPSAPPINAPPPTASTIAGGPVSADPPPIVDDVILEKTEVCAGEENLVTVKAHTPNGTDAYLHYTIDGQLGQAVPVRMFQNGKDEKVPGSHQITVFGRGNTSVTVPIPSYRVKDCQPVRAVNVESRLRANSWSDFDFHANVVVMRPLHSDKRAEPPRTFLPVKYVWKFGDGSTATTTTPITSHNFEGRPQDSLYSYFVVGVDVYGKDGEIVAGRASLALLNPAFEALAVKGVVALMISLTPRFPEMDKDGRVSQTVRLWHHRPGAVTIERVWMTKYFEGASGESKPELVNASTVLGTSTIPPGDGITTTAVLDTITEPGVQVVTYRLEGKSAEGYPVMGSFSVMVPPPKPTADNAQKIGDRTLKAKIMAARALLGKDVVTDEDLWQLEREGKFANLVVPPPDTPPGPAPPPPATPPGPNMGTVPIAQGPAAPKSTAEQAALPEHPAAGPPDMTKPK